MKSKGVEGEGKNTNEFAPITDEACDIFWTENSETNSINQIDLSPNHHNQENHIFRDSNLDYNQAHGEDETPKLYSRNKFEPLHPSQVDSFRQIPQNVINLKNGDNLEVEGMVSDSTRSES